MAWTGVTLADDGLAGRAAAALDQAQYNPTTVASAPITLRAETYPDLDDMRRQTSSATIQYLDFTGWLTPRQASSLGLTLGVVSDSMGRPMGAATLGYDLGVRWRSRLDQRLQLDVHAWARTPQQTAAQDALGMIWVREQSTFGTRLEVQWSTSRTGGLTPEFGAVGVQMQGDSRLLLRARRGGPMLYYRARF